MHLDMHKIISFSTPLAKKKTYVYMYICLFKTIATSIIIIIIKLLI